MTREDIVPCATTCSTVKSHARAVKATGSNQHYTLLMMMQGARPLPSSKRKTSSGTRKSLWARAAVVV